MIWRRRFGAAILSFVLPSACFASEGVFEVKAVAVNKIYYTLGKVETEKNGGDEVTYLVNLPEKSVTRTAVYNAGIKEGLLAGLQADDSKYTIIHDEPDSLFAHGQRLIKAFGKVALLDGYETIVIGDDFVTTSRSSGNYFALVHYKRTDPIAEEYRRKHTR